MKTRTLVLFFLFTLLFGCEKESKYCPSCSDLVSWDFYGDWYFNQEGNDGWSSESTHLEYDCGWEIYFGHAGGVGNVYKVHSCDSGVVFEWMHNDFSSVTLSEGWEGSTVEGIRMGDDLSKFLEAYPDFKRYPFHIASNAYYYDARGDIFLHVTAYFTDDDKLRTLYILR